MRTVSEGITALTLFQQYDLFDDFDTGLDKLAVNMGGVSLLNPEAKDERSADAKFLDSLHDKAFAESSAGRYMESITLYDAILALSGNDARAWSGKGSVLLILPKYEEALEACDRALQIDPDNALRLVN